MEIIKGTNVVGPITPYSTLDKYPTHYAEYGKGGYRTVNTLTDLNSIPVDRCEAGMLVYVIAENKVYVCGGLDTENNLNWKESDLWVSPETYNTDKVSLSGEIVNNAYSINVLRDSIDEVQGRIDEVEAGIESLGVNIGKQLEDQNDAIDKKIEDKIADQEKKLQEGLAGVQDKLGLLQNQVDGEVVAWFLEGTPSLNNQPASDWNTDDIKKQHIGDTYTNIEKYDSTVIDSTAGQSWRWCYCEYTDENGETKTDYHWHKIADSDAIKALQEAGKAQSTADGKSKTFLTKPINGYNIGDLWILQNDKDHIEGKRGDILTANAESDVYVKEHWSKQVKYTDDTLAQEAKDAAATAQNKAEEAYSDAQQALEDLKDVHADGRVYRSEMKMLLNELEDIKEEKVKLEKEADAYDAKTYYNTYESVANNAITALEYYSSTTNLDKITKEVNGVNVSETLDYITIDKEGAAKWSDISSYYAARQQLLYEITAAAKALTDNVNTLATTANNAATEANNIATAAQQSAEAALGQLGAIATDSVVAAIEFAALETQLEIIEGEYGNILNNAAVYEDVLINYTELIENYKTAYSNAVTTLKYYSGNIYDDKGSTAQPDENGSIVILRSSVDETADDYTANDYNDYDNIGKYYEVRQELLDAVARATRTYAESLRFELSDEDINKVLAGIEIGGTNLLKNSKAREFKPWESTEDIECDINGEFTTITNNVESRQSYCTNIYQLDEDTVKNDITNLEWKGHNISISLEVKSDFSQEMRVEIASKTAESIDIWNKQGQYVQLAANKWTKLNLTFKSEYNIAETVDGKTPGTVYLIVSSDENTEANTGSKLYIKNIKIEFGSMSTEWSPAPADVEESINYANTLISNIQDQVDGVAESYFLEGTPTMSNAPVNSWSDSDYAKHVGDTYTDISEYSVLMPSMWQQGSITQDVDINNCGKDQDSDHYIRTDYIPVDNCYNLTRLSAKYDYVIFYYDAEKTCLGVEGIGDNVENTDNYNIVKNISDKTVSYIRLRLAYKSTNPQEFKPDYVYDIDIKPSINPSAGKSFRFCDCNATNDYHWCVIPSDSEVSKALAAAAQAQDTADGKRRVFTGLTDPIPPYEVGDLWAQGASNGSDLMMCQRSRLRGETGDASDWVSASSALSAANAAKRAAETATDNAKEAMQNLSDMSNDEKLTPQEKIDVISEWQRIKSEYTTNAENVKDLWGAEGNNPDAWGDYTSAYNSLSDYIGTLGLDADNKDKTNNITRTDFNNQFNTYYNCNITLQYIIAEQVAALEVKKINFGGANLLLNSKPYDNTNWECSNGNIDFKDYTITCNSDNNNIAVYATQSLDFNLNNDKEYTFSAWIKADSEGKIKFTVKDNSNTNIKFEEVTVGSDWMRYIATTEVTNITTSNNTKFWIEYVKSENTDPNNGSTLYLKELKLEKGNVASDWSPASADLIDSIRHAEEYVNSIKDQLQNQIDGVVDSWFMEGEPTLENSPAKDWIGTDENGADFDYRQRHIGDTYTDISEATLLPSSMWKQSEYEDSTGEPYLSDIEMETKDFVENKGGVLFVPTGYIIDIRYYNSDNELQNPVSADKNTQLDTSYPKFKLHFMTNPSGGVVSPSLADDLKLCINPTAGQSWRWCNCEYTDENGETKTGYHWHKIADSDAVKALVAAARAQDTADGKRRVFTSEPTPPYDEGDLWAQGSGEDGDIFMCTEGRQTGEFNTSDWAPASGAMTILNNIASDGIITKIEKIQLRKEVEIIQHETSRRYSKAMDIWGVRHDENGDLYIADYPQAGQDYYNAVIALQNYVNKIKIDENTDTILSEVGSSWKEYQEIFDEYYYCREQFDLVLDDDSINYKTGNSNNLLRYTYQKKYLDKFKGYGCTIGLDNDWIKVVPDESVEYPGYALLTDVINNKDLLEHGAQYTLSFDCYTYGNNDVESLYIRLLFSTEKSGEFEDLCSEYAIGSMPQHFTNYSNNRYSISFTYNRSEDHQGYFGVMFGSLKDTYTQFLIKNIKLELGDKATAWTPAPEDMEAEIAEVKELQSNFEESLSQINDDGYFSITEKKIIRSDWEAISGQYGVDDLLYPEEWNEEEVAKFKTWEELTEALFGENEDLVNAVILLLLYNAIKSRTGDYGEILGIIEQALGGSLDFSNAQNDVINKYFPSLNAFMEAYILLMLLLTMVKLYIPENTSWDILNGTTGDVLEGLTGREILSKFFEEYYKAETLCLNEINEYYTNNAVNNIKINHTNLLRNTNQVTYFDKFTFTNCSGELTDAGWIKITPNTVGNVYLTTDKINKNIFELNQEYILSFDAYAGGDLDNNGELDLDYIGFCLPHRLDDYYYIPENTTIKINRFEKRYNIKFVHDYTIYGDTFGAVIGFQRRSGAYNQILYIKNIKLQKGIIATDWSPAPEDMDDEIAEVKGLQESFSNSLSQIDSDEYFSIAEKKIIRSDWEAISGYNSTEKIDDYTGISGSYVEAVKMANGEVVYGALAEAFEELREFLDKYNLYTSENTSWGTEDSPGDNRETLASKFTAYYNAEIEYLNRVNKHYTDSQIPDVSGIQEQIDEVKGLQESFNASLSNINNDKYFSTVEKKIIRSDWEAVESSYDEVSKLTGDNDIKESLDTIYDNLSFVIGRCKLYENEDTLWSEIFSETTDAEKSRKALSGAFNSYYNKEIEFLNSVNQKYTDSQIPQIPDVDYLTEMWEKGTTEISGGVVMTNILQMKDANGTDVTAGLSGVNADNILLWGGATYNEAKYAAANNYLKKSDGDLITSLLKKDGTGKLGVLKIGADDVTIDGTSYDIKLDASGLGFFDNANNPVVKLSTEPLESEYSLLNQGTYTDEYIPSYSSGEIGLEFEDYSVSGDYTTNEIAQELNSYIFDCKSFNTKIKCESGYNSIGWKLKQKKDDGSYEDLPISSSAAQILKNPDLQYTILYHKPLSLNPVTVKSWTSLKNNASLSDPFIVSSPGKYEVKIRVYAKFQSRVNGKFETTNINNIVSGVKFTITSVKAENTTKLADGGLYSYGGGNSYLYFSNVNGLTVRSGSLLLQLQPEQAGVSGYPGSVRPNNISISYDDGKDVKKLLSVTKNGIMLPNLPEETSAAVGVLCMNSYGNLLIKQKTTS